MNYYDCKFTKDSKFLTKDDKGNWEELSNPNLIFTCLRKSFTFEKGVKFGQFLRWVHQNELLKTFISQYSWCYYIDEFINQLNDKNYKPKKDNWTKIKHLSVYWVSEVHSWKKETWWDSYVGFDGQGKYYVEHLKKWEDGGISISLCHLKDLENLPIVLNEKNILYDHRDVKKFKTTDMGTKTFSLLDVLDAIFWDISFHGGPKQKENFMQELDRRVDEIKSGKAKLIPAEKVFKDLRKKFKKKKKI